MNLFRIIDELMQERDRLERIIQSLESMIPSGKPPVRPTAKRRGRKSMDGPARQEVSERMKQYWAARRKERQAKEQSSHRESGLPKEKQMEAAAGR